MMRIIIYLFIGMWMSGCSPQLSPITQTLIQDYQFDDEALKQIQFYLSDDIILHRELRQGESTIDKGKISIRDGRRVEEIVFKKGTPGVYVFSPGEQRLAISFERHGDHYLIFGPTKGRRGYKEREGIYHLLAKRWEGNYGTITYGENEYLTPSRSAYVTLMVDIDKKANVERRVKEVDGRVIR